MAAAAHAARLQKIEHRTIAAGSEEVVLSFDSVVEPKAFTMGGKQPRVIFDFAGVEPYRTLRDFIPEAAIVKGVRLGIHRQGTVKTRLVFDVNALQGLQHSYRVDKGNNRLLIRFTGAGTSQPPAKLQAGVVKKKGVHQDTPAVSSAARKEKAAVSASVRTDVAVAIPAPTAETKRKSAGGPGKATAAPTRETASAASQNPAPATAAADHAPAPPRDQAAVPADSAAAVPEHVSPPSVAQDKDPAMPAPAAPTEAPYLSAIQLDPDSPKGELVQFKLNGFYPPVLRSIETGSPQVICEFTNLQVAPALEGPIKISGRFVKAIRLDKAADGSKVRVFVELEPNQSYDLQQVFFKEDNFFVLIVNTVKA